MSRKIMALTMALAIIAVVAFAVTSVAYAAGPQGTADSCYPWEGDAGWGVPYDGECDGGDMHQYGPGSGDGDSGWGEPGNCMGAERQLRAVTSIAYADGQQSAADSGYPWVDDAGHGEPGDGECDGGDQHMWGKLANGMGSKSQLRMGQQKIDEIWEALQNI